MNQKGIAVAGNLIADVGYMIDQYPKKGNLTWIYDPKPHTGGANNLIIDLARLDASLPLKVSGVVGDDENGQFIIDCLNVYPNIDTANITKEGRTAVTYAMTEKVGKQRTFFYDPGTSLSYNEAHIDFEHLDADIFHLEYLLLLGTLDESEEEFGTYGAKVLHEAQKRGMKTSIDMVSEERQERYAKVIWPALRYTDYCIVNEVEGSGATGIMLYDDNGVIEEAVWEGLAKLRDLGVREWAVIHSPLCGYGLNCQTGEQVKVPSLKLPEGFIKGTTGAGDAFCAGILYGAYKGMPIEKALRTGAECAACSLSAEDSNSGVIAIGDVDFSGFTTS